MRCRECRFDNPDGVKFCGGCGATLARRCGECGFDNPPAFRFCGNCGKALSPDEAPAEAQSPAAPEAERRQLTVLFCDLVGSTALSSRLDPEAMREVLRAYQEACSAAITGFDGYVAKFMGDGVYAYFGYPRAHEDDAERAVNAGLRIVGAIRELEAGQGEALDLAVRVGVATGMVAVGDIVGQGASEEAAVVGETPNLTARLQEIARPNTVVISAETHALAGGLFETECLGARGLKGFAEPVTAWTVLGPRRTESRFEAMRGEALTELVGRDDELETLARHWRRAEAGDGRVVLISGEPGIGKSRLVRELQDRIAGTPHFRLRYQCSPYHANSALHPVIEQIERAARLDAADDAAARLDKLAGVLALSGRPVDDVLPLVAALVSVPTEDRFPPPGMTPERQKALTLQALVDHLSGLAGRRPVLFVLEDAHWIDPTTLELMDRVVECVPHLSVLVVITYRPEFAAPWVGRSRVASIILGRLDERDCGRMVDCLAANATLPAELRARIAGQTDGVPLFVEELTKSVVETVRGSSQRPAAIEVPATLQDSLEARLDRLGPAKELAQIGAAVGREFDHALLARVASDDGEALDAALKSLVGSGLVTVRGVPPNATYRFKHALVRDTAYDGLLRGQRRRLHSRIAAVLEDGGPDSTPPEILAHHFTEAGEIERAVPYWQAAGTHAVRYSANAEAINYFERALALLRSLPDTDERARTELELLSGMSPAVVAAKGMSAPEVRDVHDRALRLADRIGDATDKQRALFGVWLFNVTGQNFDEARGLTRRMVALAEETGDSGHELQAHHTIWSTAFLTGDVAGCYRHCLDGGRLYDKQEHASHAVMYGGHDPGSCALNFASVSAFVLGYPDQAGHLADRSVGLAEDVGHRFSVALSLLYKSQALLLCGAFHEAIVCAERAARISTESGFPVWAHADVIRSLAGLAAGTASGGLDEVLRATLRQSGPFDAFRPHWLSELSGAFAAAGRLDEAVDILAEADRLAGGFGLNWAQPELSRRRGELLAARGGPDDEVEACYLEALARARRLEAKIWELKAATSLARLRAGLGRATEAREVLAPVYSWFTEGFETADLKQAKAVLDALS